MNYRYFNLVIYFLTVEKYKLKYFLSGVTINGKFRDLPLSYSVGTAKQDSNISSWCSAFDPKVSLIQIDIKTKKSIRIFGTFHC